MPPRGNARPRMFSLKVLRVSLTLLVYRPPQVVLIALYEKCDICDLLSASFLLNQSSVGPVILAICIRPLACLARLFPQDFPFQFVFRRFPRLSLSAPMIGVWKLAVQSSLLVHALVSLDLS